MTPYYEAPDVTLYCGDALTVLQTLASASVQMVCTSPPFYALRDYGTARWEGGAADCDHIERLFSRNKDFNARWGNSPGRAAQESGRSEQFRDRCGKCGAVRVDQQLGLEPTLREYLDRLVGVFREVKRVLRPDGTVWVELGDSYAAGGGFSPTAPSNQTSMQSRRAEGTTQYKGRQPVAGFKPKDLMLVPHRFAIAMQEDGWWVRQEIVWHKLAPMPESTKDRCTRAHSFVFMFTKNERYFYDSQAIAEPGIYSANGTSKAGARRIRNVGGRTDGFTRLAEPGGVGTPEWGRNKRSVWSLSPEPFSEAHFATFPTKLVEPCILAGSRPGDTVLDPFAGSGTTLLVARKFGRKGLGIELNENYCAMAVRRIEGQTPALALFGA